MKPAERAAFPGNALIMPNTAWRMMSVIAHSSRHAAKSTKVSQLFQPSGTGRGDRTQKSNVDQSTECESRAEVAVALDQRGKSGDGLLNARRGTGGQFEGRVQQNPARGVSPRRRGAFNRLSRPPLRRDRIR